MRISLVDARNIEQLIKLATDPPFMSHDQYRTRSTLMIIYYSGNAMRVPLHWDGRMVGQETFYQSNRRL